LFELAGAEGFTDGGNVAALPVPGDFAGFVDVPAALAIRKINFNTGGVQVALIGCDKMSALAIAPFLVAAAGAGRTAGRPEISVGC